jgi:hypothetical protein
MFVVNSITRGSVGCPCVAHLSFFFEETLYRTFHTWCFLPSFGSFDSEEYLEINQSETIIACDGEDFF